ncbi:MAG: Lon protease family protein, partial [Planctomycetota bacterium]
MREPLSREELRWVCDPAGLDFESTATVAPVNGVIGQEDAVNALRFGLESYAPGQNIFVRGLTGTGRMTMIRRLLEEIRPACAGADDRCYVHNFAQPDRPRLLTVPRGTAQDLRRRVDAFCDFIRDELPGALQSETMEARRKVIDRRLTKEIAKHTEPFEAAIKKAGLAVVSVPVGPTSTTALFPLVDGKPVAPEEFEELRDAGKVDDAQYKAYEKSAEKHGEELEKISKALHRLRRKHQETVRGLVAQETRAILGEFVAEIRTDFRGNDVRSFLREVMDDVVELQRGPAREDGGDPCHSYRVNVVLGHGADEPCPVIVENAPTLSNLLGQVDRQIGPAGQVTADYSMIRAGSLLQADGGYIILEARDVLGEPGAWKVLERTLRTGRLDIVPPEFHQPWWGTAAKPEPIQINVKVVLLGSSEIYHLLDDHDAQFSYLFKVLADFDNVIARDQAGLKLYAGVLSRLSRDEDLLAFDRTAVARLAEHGARIASRARKLTARFGRVADIAREAAFVAGKDGRKIVTAEDVRETVRRMKRRGDLPSRRFREFLKDGTVLVETQGASVGQINGLALLRAGPLTYGFPARITATIGAGTAGVINIERESTLSGAIHTKGFYILGGLLRHLLRTDHPLAFSASVAFEQSYGGIDGDSASGAEVCCLLSALTGVPLRQDLAMTGAIDQRGHVMAVGGVDEKIEGFYDTCNDLGLSGQQGVLIPTTNAKDLMLREDVVEACAQGKFHVYAIANIYEALELLTGMPAGVRDENDEYPEGSLLALALERAHDFWVMGRGTQALLDELEERAAEEEQQEEVDQAAEEA